jgi:hypothetical protein
MELTEERYQEIKGLLPKRRGHIKIENRTPLNARIYRGESGCIRQQERKEGVEGRRYTRAIQRRSKYIPMRMERGIERRRPSGCPVAMRLTRVRGGSL